ncbi:hypothetical protein FA15DRAFT_40417 [Coprinopsis marcescibilis]|uniref:Uncharacterized protein n=1 Tax=Coprinopsis marcescibilis TaxID=230819 RepID=A0A5C3L6V6_COPMA|nr:hypothetical protein FA15DRAFT_40417 [Coprinopsis marcescibilis]
MHHACNCRSFPSLSISYLYTVDLALLLGILRLYRYASVLVSVWLSASFVFLVCSVGIMYHFSLLFTACCMLVRYPWPEDLCSSC